MPYLIKSLVLSREESKDKGVQETTEMIVARYEAGINQFARNDAIRICRQRSWAISAFPTPS